MNQPKPEPAPEPLDYTTATSPLPMSEWMAKMNRHLAGVGLMIAAKLLSEEDLMIRLQVTRTEAKRILNKHADLRVGRRWRMSEKRFLERVRLGKF